ncbi:MAG: universal stress protein [Proteobacteria bacterium]|nr:universal stress protein [Pseudomonadota bacterium]
MMKFLLGFNGTEEAKAALTLARTHAEIFKAKVFIITSMGGGRGEKAEEINKTTRDLEFAEKFLKEKGIACETIQLARGMSPGEDVVSFAEEHEIDQIFVGVEKKSRTQKILLGSTAQYIILKAPCPVVSVNRSFK